MLHLQIGFPGGRYWAADHADPTQPEWPPHPSRVYSALVAGAYGGNGQIAPEERRLLDRLAAADPPELAFPDADRPRAATSYVPVNDEATRLKPGKSSGVLGPNRQARQFPGAYLLAEPELHLFWHLSLTADELAVLDGIAARLTHVGTSHSLATAQFRHADDSAMPPRRWVPAAEGRHFLRVPRTGRLTELDEQVARRSQRDELRRHLPRCETLVAYRPADQLAPPRIAAQHDWLALRLDDASWGAADAHTLARAARRALMALLGEQVPPALHGHAAEGEHLLWLPLPDVGHTHASARIRGLAIGFPRSLPPADAAVLVRGLQRLQTLHLPDGQTARLLPVLEGDTTPQVLRTATWCRASTHWASVTPVILDRPPKKPDADRLLHALAESLALAGWPEPVELRLSRTSAHAGAPTALDVATRLPRYHASVRFAQPVEGPLVAGRWRHFGIGLFRPLAAQDWAQATSPARAPEATP